MPPDKPFTYEGPEIIYPERKVYIINGEEQWQPDNPSELLRRGLEAWSLLSLARNLHRDPDNNII